MKIQYIATFQGKINNEILWTLQIRFVSSSKLPASLETKARHIFNLLCPNVTVESLTVDIDKV